MITILRRLAPALFASLALFATVSGAFAHAKLEDSDPPENGTIATPYVLVARFDEELAPAESSVVVRDSGGTVVAEGGVTDDTFTMVVELPAVPPGAYVAHWIAITADDNGKTQGDINFTVVAATPSPVPTPTLPDGTPGPTPSPSPSSVPTAPGVTPSPASTASPTPTPGPETGQPSGSELIVPLVLAGAVAVALGWFLLRRRPS